jgi:hypothetical protein
MATQADVRRIASNLPGAREAPHHFAFEVVSLFALRFVMPAGTPRDRSASLSS